MAVPSSLQIAVGNRTVYDARKLYIYAREQQYETEHWAQKANRLTMVRGKMPSVGYFLLKQSDVDALNENGSHTIQFRENLGGNLINDRAAIFYNFRIVSVKSVYASYEGSTVNAGGMALVELADPRHVLAMSSAVMQSYNVLCPAAPSFTAPNIYDSESLNGSSLWTWQTMLESLWAKLPASVAGTAPLLPYTPHGAPLNFHYWDWSAWDAINDLLNKLNCSIIYQHTNSTPTLAIVSFADNQPSINSQISSLVNASRRIGAYVPQTPACSTIPATIRVLFPRIPQHYGTEPETSRTGNVRQSPYTYIDVATGITGAIAGTVYTVKDDLPAIIAFDTTTVVNSADLTSRANEVAGKLTLRLVNTRWIRQAFSGLAINIYPREELESVAYEDLGVGDGLVTEIFNRPQYSFGSPGDFETLHNQGRSHHSLSFRKTWGLAGESLGLQDSTNKTFPDKVQMVVVDFSAPTVLGDTVTANSNGFFDGKVCRVNPAANFTTNTAPYNNYEDCWIAVVDVTGGSGTGAACEMPAGQRLIGRLDGSVDGNSAGDIRPLYLVTRGASVSTARMITIQSTTADSGNCLWASKISTLSPIPTGFCTDPFGVGAECWLLVLNSDLGSYNTVKTQLVVGEQYIGFYVGNHPSDNKPIFATRIEDNRLYHVTYTVAIDAGNIGVVSVPIAGGINVNATNWGNRVEIGDKGIAFQDLTGVTWYTFKPGGGDPLRWIEGTVYSAFTKDTPRFRVIVTRDFSSTQTALDNIEVENFEDPGSSPKPYLFEGETGACCTVLWDKSSNLYRVVWVECPENPVNVSPGDNPQPSEASLYNSGGFDEQQLNSYYE